jgi:anti-anti-sigma regulatory factor
MNIRSDLLDVIIDRRGPRVRVCPYGPLCLASLPLLDAVLEGVLSMGSGTLVEFDLSGTTMLGSAGVERLEATATLLSAIDGELVITGASGLVRRVIELLDASWLLVPASAG